MVSQVTITAPAKVNLALQVAPLGSDGYHEVRSVYTALDLHDTLVFRGAPRRTIRVDVLGLQAPLVPRRGRDLAGRAARLLRDHCGRPDLGVAITLTKKVPVAGGMAGGSADAAASLRGCNELWQLGASDDELVQLARQLGADVPFALLGGVAHGSGRGDILTPWPAKGTLTWVFALAPYGLSTADVFATFDRLPPPKQQPSLEPLRAALEAGDATAIGANLSNDLAAAAIALQPELAQTLDAGRHLPGVLGAVLSGAGPTCAFLCANEESAQEAAKALAAQPQVCDTKLVKSPAPGVSLVS